MSLADGERSAAARTKAFISYARRDLAFVDDLVSALEANGISALIDRTEIYALEPWWPRIEALIKAADAVVFVLSPDSLASGICQKELQLAQDLGKRLAPIVCRSVADVCDKIPNALGALNFIFFDGESAFADALRTLIDALETDIAWVREHTRLEGLASRWRAHGESDVLLLRGDDLIAAEAWLAGIPEKAPQPTNLHRALIDRSRARSDARQRSIRAAVQSCNDTIVGIVHKFRDREGIPQSVILGSLQSAYATVASIPAEEQKDAQLQRTLGFALAELALAQLSTNDVDGAIAAASRAVEIFEGLCKLVPDDLNRQADLFAGLDRWGDALLAARRLDDAFLVYRRNLSVANTVSAMESSICLGDWQGRLSISLEKTGDVKLMRGEWNGALEDYRSSLAFRQAIADKQPDDLEPKRDLALIEERIGDALLKLGRIEEAEASYTSSVRTTRQVSESSPGHASWQRELAIAVQRLADFHTVAGKTMIACVAYDESREIIERLISIDGSNIGWKLDALRVYDRLGRARQRAGEAAAALDAFRRGAEIAKILADTEPARADWRAIAGMSQNICRILLETKSANTALVQAQADVLLLESAPASEMSSSRRSRGWNNVAWYALLAQDLGAAREASSRAIELKPNDLQITLNRIHVLGLSGASTEARALLAATCQTIGHQHDEWDAAVQSDLREMHHHQIDIGPLTEIFETSGATTENDADLFEENSL